MSLIGLGLLNGQMVPVQYRCDRCGKKGMRWSHADPLPKGWSATVPPKQEEGAEFSYEGQPIICNPTFATLDDCPRHYCGQCRRANVKPSEN